MSHRAPGKAYREGISLIELGEMFPDEDAAVKWFESIYWEGKRVCGHCQSEDTSEVPNAKPMPYWCKTCRSYFSVRTGTVLQSSRLPLRKWAFAVYLFVTNLKGISSMKLHRDLNITQKSAWHMLHRLRESWSNTGLDKYDGPVEVDETYFGGKESNKHESKKLRAGRGTVGKTAVVGAKDRESNNVSANVVESTNAETLVPFVESRASTGATIYTDDASAYDKLPTISNDYKHDSVKHSAREYVRGDVHTNGIESFWSMLKRAYMGTFHQLSEKHLDRYVQEFVLRHNIRENDTHHQMAHVVSGLVGKRLMYAQLVA